MRKKLPPIQPDEQAINAARRAATGANEHGIGEAIERYRWVCRLGVEREARAWKFALYLLSSGKTTRASEAWNTAQDYLFEQRKEELRKLGKWSTEWEPYLGKSPN